LRMVFPKNFPRVTCSYVARLFREFFLPRLRMPSGSSQSRACARKPGGTAWTWSVVLPSYYQERWVPLFFDRRRVARRGIAERCQSPLVEEETNRPREPTTAPSSNTGTNVSPARTKSMSNSVNGTLATRSPGQEWRWWCRQSRCAFFESLHDGGAQFNAVCAHG
jgi:hypothetical protein